MSDMAAVFSIIGVNLAALATATTIGAWVFTQFERRVDQRFTALETDMTIIKQHLLGAGKSS